MSADDELDAEIVQEFLIESHDNLDQLDRDLVALEETPGSRELLGSIFRTIHTIKGTSGFLAFGRLESLTHAGENVLALMRDGRLVLDATSTTVLLRMVDAVRDMLGNIEQQGTEGEMDVSAIVEALGDIREGRVPAGFAAPAPPAGSTGSTGPAGPTGPTGTTAPEAGPVPAAADATPAPAPAPSAGPAPATPATGAPAPVTPAPVAAAPAPSRPAAEGGEEAPTEARATESSIRVDVTLLETLVRLAGELVLARNQIVQRAGTLGDEDLSRVCHRLNQVTGELQEGVMRTRMQPIDHVWSKLPRMVRDLGSQLGRSVRLEMEGGDTELDRTLLDAVKDPLTHLVRNAVDHGIEKPEDRVLAGKPSAGVLRLRAAHEGGQITVEVSDDGKGLDPEKLGPRAVEKGLITAAQLTSMSAQEVTDLVFVPGFSTAAAVTNVSGRGVGMDVVRTNIERIGGSIEVESVPGRGTVWRLRIPLTLAIVPALKLLCAGQRFAIPQTAILELVNLDPGTQLESVGGAEVHRLRGSLLPVLRLDRALGLADSRPVDDPEETGTVIAVLESDGRRFGLIVDRVLDTEDIVVKPVSAAIKEMGTFAGATIMGDGRVSLILDVQNLTRTALRGQEGGPAKVDTAAEVPAAARRSGRRRSQLLVVDAGGGRRVAIPLEAVTRLEQFPVASLEHVGRREVVRYRGEIMPLVRLADHLGALDDRSGRDTLAGVVYTENGRTVALAVDDILDIEDGDDSVYSDVNDHGLIGSALIGERVTEMLDVRSAILAADPSFFEREHLLAEEVSV